MTLDGVGEWATASFGHGRDNRITLTHQQNFPHSLGLLYSAFTYYCGFKVNSGEYKLMARPHVLRTNGGFRLAEVARAAACDLSVVSRRVDGRRRRARASPDPPNLHRPDLDYVSSGLGAIPRTPLSPVFFGDCACRRLGRIFRDPMERR
jgi:hypothetical protein